MSKININMPKKDMQAIKDVGFRFLLFRRALGKREAEFASELNISVPELTAIETGESFPAISCLHYLYEKYGLNINWLLTKNGHMFTEQPRFDKHTEILNLMRVPAVEKAIEAALLEIKALLKLEKQDRSKKE